MSLAQRNLYQNKVRLSLSAVGVALSVMLILILNGFLTGVHRQATAYLDNSPGSVVVVQEGIRNFFAASSVLPPGTVTSVRETKGVSRALAIASQFVIFELHDEKQGAQVVGYDPDSGGGPWELSEGRDVRDGDEAVVDRALAKAHDISVGDTLTIGERDFTVVGISEGTSMWAAGLMFVRKDAAQGLMGSGAVWYGDVPNKRCVRVREGGEVLQTIDLDRGCFACMLGGVDRRTLFLVVREWGGMESTAEGARTGQLLTAPATAPGAGWP
jgi:ABC-type lipoprotein release transport system permease subunit